MEKLLILSCFLLFFAGCGPKEIDLSQAYIRNGLCYKVNQKDIVKEKEARIILIKKKAEVTAYNELLKSINNNNWRYKIKIDEKLVKQRSDTMLRKALVRARAMGMRCSKKEIENMRKTGLKYDKKFVRGMELISILSAKVIVDKESITFDKGITRHKDLSNYIITECKRWYSKPHMLRFFGQSKSLETYKNVYSNCLIFYNTYISAEK